MSKDYLTYNAQMKYLRNKKGINCSGSYHKQILIRNGYFNLINGYKDPFTTGKDAHGCHIYVPNTSIDAILKLKWIGYT